MPAAGLVTSDTAEHLRAGGAGSDRFVHGGHADQVGAQRAQHPDLGGCLVLRPAQPRVDALGQRRIDLAGDRAQPRRVRVGHVDELRADQRRSAGQIEVVADQHRLAHREVLAEAACGIGQHDRADARGAGGAHRVYDVAQFVPFVGVDPADEHQHPLVADAQRQQLSGMAFRGGRGEAR